MDRYQKVERPKAEIPISENEVRITSQGLIRNYLSYASTLLQERNSQEIVLKAMGQAISKTVAIAEIMKKRMPQLYQDTTISSVSLTDVWEPIEEGLLRVETTRQVSMIAITLSTKEITNKSPGYQAPKHVEQPKPQKQHQQLQAPRQPLATYNAAYGDFYGRGHGRSRGRGQGRAFGSGGYSDYYQGNGGYADGGYENNRYRGGYGYGSYSDGLDNGGGYGGGYYYGGHKGGYSNGGYRGGYDGGYENGGGRGRSTYRGGGYESQRGRGGGGRGYARGRGQDVRSTGRGY